MRQPWRIPRMPCQVASRARARGSERESDPRHGKVIHAGFLVRAARMGRLGTLSGQPPPSPSAGWEPTILAPARYGPWKRPKAAYTATVH